LVIGGDGKLSESRGDVAGSTSANISMSELEFDGEVAAGDGSDL